MAKSTDLLGELTQRRTEQTPDTPETPPRRSRRPKKKFTELFSVRLSPAQYAALERHLDAHGETVAAGARRILVEYLKNQGLI
jgi:hypothetical protein